MVECRGMAAVMPLKFGCEQGMGVIYSDKQIAVYHRNTFVKGLSKVNDRKEREKIVYADL